MGASLGEYRGSLRDRVVSVWTGAALDEPIEELLSFFARLAASRQTFLCRAVSTNRRGWGSLSRKM